MSLIIRTPQQLQAEALARHRATIAAAVDARIEAQARALGYNSAAHLAGYVASTVPGWAAEAQTFVAWRDAVWLAAFDLEADAQETGEVPSLEAVIDALPEWGTP